MGIGGMLGRRRRIFLVFGAVALLAVVLVVVVLQRPDDRNPPRPLGCSGSRPVGHGPAGAADKPFVGTLGTHASNAGREAKAGIRMSMLELEWRRFEPQRNHVDLSYVQAFCARLLQMQRAKLPVTLGLGMHFTPGWVRDMPDSRFVDQDGKVSADVDMVFSARMRDVASNYVRRVNELIGFRNFWAVRVTSGGTGELVYPSGNTYWAFNDGARNGSDKPASLADNPAPDWRPAHGDTSVSAATRTAWLEWYVGALADVAEWQIRLLRDLGFDGWVQLLTPGRGVQPVDIEPLVAAALPTGTAGRGAVWSWLYEDIDTRANVMAYVTSVADGSGADKSCKQADSTVALDSSEVTMWSASRWISRVAHAYGYAVSGEVAGYPREQSAQEHYSDASTDGLAAIAYRQATACGFVGLYWAHDDQVHDGTLKLSTLAKLAGDDPELPAAPPPITP